MRYMGASILRPVVDNLTVLEFMGAAPDTQPDYG